MSFIADLNVCLIKNVQRKALIKTNKNPPTLSKVEP
jgi:hypothetical protein